MDRLILSYCAVSIFKAAAEKAEQLIRLAAADAETDRMSAAAEVFYAVADSGTDTTGQWLASLIERDENPFSRAAAKGERISDRVKAQVESELITFKQLSLLRPENYFDGEAKRLVPAFGYGGFDLTYDKLVAFYAKSGCGALACGDAFVYTREGFTPVGCDGARLDDLKNYDEEKTEVVKNTENFINGLPAFHTLLYGDRGTGKSTTVRALGAEYRGKLKLIELDSRDLELLPELSKKLSGLKQKFIIFIDDLTFDENDSRADGFKAALEGSLDACAGGNALIYCTSNRRHLFKETDKDNMRNRNDEVQAELALFDRFGLVVTYINPDKSEFLDIFKKILTSRGIKWREEYASVAELAALKKGGRTPRAAKQIADLIETTYAENIKGEKR